MFALKLLCIFICVFYSNCVLLTSPSSAGSYVEQLIHNYFREEEKLWTSLENRADNLLPQIYRMHEEFLNDVISNTESGVFNKYLVPGHYKLVLIGLNLNGTTKLGYSNLRDKEFDREFITDYANSALKILKDASEMFDFTNNASFWEGIISHFKICHKSAETVESSYQVIFDYYKDIQAGLLKSYITGQLSYMILTYYKGTEESYREQSTILENTFTERFARIKDLAKQHLALSSKDLWKCDVALHKLSTAYTEVTNFLQGYVDNEANLNEDGSCKATCMDYVVTRHYNCVSGSLCDSSENQHESAKCEGVIRNCDVIDNADLTICEIGEENRRYNAIRYNDGRIAGYEDGICHAEVKSKAWLRWFVKCSNCFCLCETPANRKSDRYFSLREVVSDVIDNRVVTGVMLTKQKGVIHLAILQRKLLPYGQTEVSSPIPQLELWKPNNDFFAIDDFGVQKDIDYHTLSYENRSINLDTVTTPAGHLVTGVRFRVINRHITLEIRATSFDYQSGTLKNIQDSKWISNPNGGQIKIPLQRVANPVKSVEKSVPNPTLNAYVDFGPTEYWADLSQLTVPFLEIQTVEPYIPVALSGVGLYYKGQPGFGGYIAPKLVVYPFEPHLVEK